MKIKPKDIAVNLPAVHLFDGEAEMAIFALAINTIIHGKVRVKYELLGMLGGQCVGLFYLKRNNESQEIHDQFVQLIEEEEMTNKSRSISKENPKVVGTILSSSKRIHNEDCGCKSCVGM
jgi:hypothetical protein